MKLYDSCGVHSLMLGEVSIHMLVEKKYPLPQDTHTRMLRWKLHVNYNVTEMAYELLSIVETDKVNHAVETDMVKLVVEIESFGMSADELDKETGSSDGLQPKQADLSCVHALNEPHLHEIHVVPSKHEADQSDNSVYSCFVTPFSSNRRIYISFTTKLDDCQHPKESLCQQESSLKNLSYALSWKPCQGDSLNLPDHRIHKDGDGDASFQLKSDSLPHAHAQTTKTFYKHQDSRIMKAQELNDKVFRTNSDIQDLPSKISSLSREIVSLKILSRTMEVRS
ncbi:hypothetical protein Tco_0356627 [Tanacetum coccineum]